MGFFNGLRVKGIKIGDWFVVVEGWLEMAKKNRIYTLTGLAAAGLFCAAAGPVSASSQSVITGSFNYQYDYGGIVNLSYINGVNGLLSDAFVKVAEPVSPPNISTNPPPSGDVKFGTALSSISLVGNSSDTSIFEDYAPSSPNPSPTFTDIAGDFSDTAGIRNNAQPVAIGEGYSFTYADQTTPSILNIFVGGYSVTAALTANGAAVPGANPFTVADGLPGEYGEYVLNVPANSGKVTFDYLATKNGASSVSNVSIFAASAGAVPLPKAASVGFWMLGGFGVVAAIRRRLRHAPRIA